MRASSVPTLFAGCLNKRSSNFLSVARVGLCCGFCDFAISFLAPPYGPKNGTVKVVFFSSFSKLCMWSQNGTARRPAFLGVDQLPPLWTHPTGRDFVRGARLAVTHFWDRVYVHFLKFFVSGLQKRNVLVSISFNETLWLMATGRATREALLSEAGFEKVFRTQNWVR